MQQTPIQKIHGKPSERGFVMILTLMVLVILTMLCMAGLDNSNIEVKVAANDRQNRVAFHLDDGGLDTFCKLADVSLNGSWATCGEIMAAQNADTATQIFEDEETSFGRTNDESFTFDKVQSSKKMSDGFCERLYYGENLLPPNEADWELTIFGTGTVRVRILGADKETLPGGGIASHEGASGAAVSSGKSVVFDVIATGLSARNTNTVINARYRKLIM